MFVTSLFAYSRERDKEDQTMAVDSSELVLCESSTSILKFLLGQRLVIEREMNERLSLLIQDIPKTEPNFDSFVIFLTNEAKLHYNLANSLADYAQDSVTGGEALIKTMASLKKFYEAAVQDLERIRNQIISTVNHVTKSKSSPMPAKKTDSVPSLPLAVNGPVNLKKLDPSLGSNNSITPTNKTKVADIMVPVPAPKLPPPKIEPLKPPSEITPSSNRSKWFKSKKSTLKSKRKQGEPKTETDSSSPQSQGDREVDEDGFSVRPVVTNDDMDSFYSSSDEGEAVGENKDAADTKPEIHFVIKPIDQAEAVNNGDTTAKLKETALNLVIPDRPIIRGRGHHHVDAKRNTIDVSDMLGIMKHSVSQRSLHSDCSAVSDNDSLPPPMKPPPRTNELLQPTPANQVSQALNSTQSSESSSDTLRPSFDSDFNKSFRSQTIASPSSNTGPNQSDFKVTVPPPVLPARRPQSSVTIGRPLPSVPVPPPRPPGAPNGHSTFTKTGIEPVVSENRTPPVLPPKLPPRRTSVTSQSGPFERASFMSKTSSVDHVEFGLDPFAPESAQRGRPASRNGSCSSATSATFNPGTMSVVQTGFELPLSFSFHEKISAVIKSEDIASSTVQILGSLNLLFPKDHVQKVASLKLGKICFEVPDLIAFQDSISINCLEPLVQVREKEAVDDPVVYEIEPSNLLAYIETKPQMNAYPITLIQYQIKVDKNTECVEESMHLAPLQIMSYCKSGDDSINVKIEYMYNEGAFPGTNQPPLLETAILARVTDGREVDQVTTDPNALWDSPHKQAIWQLGALSPDSVPSKGAGVLKAKFSMKGNWENTHEGAQKRVNGSCSEVSSATSGKGKSKKIVAVGARFRCEGSVTGIKIKLADNSNNYSLSQVIHNTTSGQYVSLTV